MTKISNFQPNWASPPGHTMEEALEEACMTQVDFARRMGLSTKHVNELLKGKVALTPEVALKLESVLGSPTSFWLRREAQYREDLARLAALEQAEKKADWLQELPLSDMIKLGWVRKFAHKGAQVNEALRFFAVASVDAWRQTFSQPAVAFRASPTFAKNSGAVAAWKRQAEIEGSKVQMASFDKPALKARLGELRTLTLERRPDVFVPGLSRLCAELGIAVVLVPTPKGCPVSGAAWFSAPDRAVIALSLRHKTNDHLWFSFFHEVGHLVLHSKKLAFIDIEGVEGLDHDAELQANEFAVRTLFPTEKAYLAFAARARTTLLSRAAVTQFAQSNGIAPGIVVGRLQREGILPWTHLNGLKVRYQWDP